MHEIDELKKKYGKGFYSRIVDIYDEERKKSKTFEWSEIQLDSSISIIDTPGHKSFISELIEPAMKYESSLIGILCVSSIDGEFDAG